MILIECANLSDNRHHDEDHAAVDASPQQFLAILPCRNVTRWLTFCEANDQQAYHTQPLPPPRQKIFQYLCLIFIYTVGCKLTATFSCVSWSHVSVQAPASVSPE